MALDNDELLEALYNSYGDKKNVGTMQRSKLKRAQYQLMKQFYENLDKYSDPRRFAIAPSFDDEGNIQYGWEDFEPYVQSGMYKRVLDAMREKPELGLGFYSSPRDYAMMTALREGLGWDDAHLYNPEDPDWKTIATSPLARNLMLFGEGLLPEKIQTLVNDDVLTTRRDASQVIGDVGQSALEVGLPIAGTVAGTVVGGPFGGLVGGAIGGGLGSLADDAIDYARSLPQEELARRLLAAETEPDSTGNYQLPTDVNFSDISANDAPISDYRGWEDRALLNTAAGAFMGMLPVTAKALKTRFGDLGNMLKVAARNGDNPLARKELIYQGLHGAAEGAGNEARSVGKFLADNGITEPSKVPDDFLDVWDRFVAGKNSFDEMFSEPYRTRNIDANNIVGTPRYEIDFGVPTRGEIKEAQANATKRLQDKANENFVETASGARNTMNDRISNTDAEAADLIATVANDPWFATRLLPEGYRYTDNMRKNIEPALGAVRQYLPSVRGDIAREAESAYGKSVSGAKKTRDNAVKVAPAQGARIGFAEANRDNVFRLPQGRAAKRLVEKNPELFKNLDLGHNQEYDTALELFRIGQQPENPINQIFMRNSRRLLPEGEGAGLKPSITRLNKDKSAFATSGEAGSTEGLKRMYDVKNFDWSDAAGANRTEDVLKATEENHARKVAAKAGINPSQYAKLMKKGSVKPGSVKSEPDVPWYRKMGVVTTKAMRLGKDALLPPINVGGPMLLRRLPQFIGNDNEYKAGD